MFINKIYAHVNWPISDKIYVFIDLTVYIFLICVKSLKIGTYLYYQIYKQSMYVYLN